MTYKRTTILNIYISVAFCYDTRSISLQFDYYLDIRELSLCFLSKTIYKL